MQAVSQFQLSTPFENRPYLLSVSYEHKTPSALVTEAYYFPEWPQHHFTIYTPDFNCFVPEHGTPF